jgi:hypothetical protein
MLNPPPSTSSSASLLLLRNNNNPWLPVVRPPTPPPPEMKPEDNNEQSSSPYSDLITFYPSSSFSSEPYLDAAQDEFLFSLDVFTDQEISQVCDILTDSQETRGFVIPLELCEDNKEPYEEWRGPASHQITKWFESKFDEDNNKPTTQQIWELELTMPPEEEEEDILCFSPSEIKHEIIELGDDDNEEDMKPWVEELIYFKSASQLLIEGKMTLSELLDMDYYPFRKSSELLDSEEELGNITLTELLRTSPPVPLESNSNTETIRTQKRKWKQVEAVQVQLEKEKKTQLKKKAKKVKKVEVKQEEEQEQDAKEEEEDNVWPPLKPIEYYSYEFIMHEGLKDRS